MEVLDFVHAGWHTVLGLVPVHACSRAPLPPTMVMNVMSSVCVLLKESTEWARIRHIMVDPVTFLRRLTSLDRDKVTDKVGTATLSTVMGISYFIMKLWSVLCFTCDTKVDL